MSHHIYLNTWFAQFESALFTQTVIFIIVDEVLQGVEGITLLDVILALVVPVQLFLGQLDLVVTGPVCLQGGQCELVKVAGLGPSDKECSVSAILLPEQPNGVIAGCVLKKPPVQGDQT